MICCRGLANNLPKLNAGVAMEKIIRKILVIVVFHMLLFLHNTGIASQIECYQEPDILISNISFNVPSLSQEFPIGTTLYVLTCTSEHFKNFTTYVYPFSQAQMTAGKFFLKRMEEVRFFAIEDSSGPGFEDPTEPFTTNGYLYEILSGVGLPNGKDSPAGTTGSSCLDILGKFGLQNVNPDLCDLACLNINLTRCFSSINIHSKNSVVETKPDDDLSKIQNRVDSNIGTPTHEFMHSIQINSYFLNQSDDYQNSSIEESQANWFRRAKWLHILDGTVQNASLNGIPTDSWGYDNFLFFSYLSETFGNKVIKQIMDYYRERTIIRSITVWEAHKKFLSETDSIKKSISQIMLEANIYYYSRKFYFPNPPDYKQHYTEIENLPFQESVPIRDPLTAVSFRPSFVGVKAFKISNSITSMFNAKIYFDRGRDFSAALLIKYPNEYHVIPFNKESLDVKYIDYRIIGTAIEMFLIIAYGDSEGGYHFLIQERKPSEKLVQVDINNENNYGWQMISVPVVPKFPIPNHLLSKYGGLYSVLKNTSKGTVVDGNVVGASTLNKTEENFPKISHDNNAYIVFSCPNYKDSRVKKIAPDCLWLETHGIISTPNVLNLQGVSVDSKIIEIPLVKGFNLIGNVSRYMADFSTDIKIKSGVEDPITLSEAIKFGHISVYPMNVDKYGPQKWYKYTPHNNYLPKAGESFWIQALRDNLKVGF